MTLPTPEEFVKNSSYNMTVNWKQPTSEAVIIKSAFDLEKELIPQIKSAVLESLKVRDAQIAARLEEARKQWCDYSEAAICKDIRDARENYCHSCSRMFGIIEELRGAP